MYRPISSLLLFSSLFFVTGCSNTATVAPSQNSSLQAISPSTTAVAQGGAMQRSLDTWLKEEWTPMSEPATQATAPDSNTTTTTVVTQKVDEAPFTLQQYADKWKVYHENKEKMNANKPKEPSNVEKLDKLPVIGK